MSDPQKNTDLAAVRSALWARLEGARGRDYWRSLDDLAATPEFQDLLEREFPRQAVGWSEDEDPVQGRRNFLKLMGASLALAGMTACTRQPTEHIMPYVRQPEDLIPGRPLFFATAATLNGVANSHVTLGARTLTIASGSTTYAGIIGGTGGLTLTAGTETLSGVNTYAGATTINGGTLALNGTGSIASSSQVNLTNAAGTFDISGKGGSGPSSTTFCLPTTPQRGMTV